MGFQDPLGRAAANILLADTDVSIRRAVRNALVADGYQNIRIAGSLIEVRGALDASIVDAVILDVDLPGGAKDSAVQAISELRHGNYGRNPFAPVIMMSWKSDSDIVGRVINCGTDALLIKPLSPAQVLDGMDRLARQRSPFVVTADYMGPDRRKGREVTDIRLFEPPNTLKERIEGKEIDEAALTAEIEAVMGEMNDERVVRGAYQVAFLVELIGKACDEGRKVDPYLARLSEVSREVFERSAATQFASVRERCHALLKVLGELDRSKAAEPGSLRALMKPLAEAIMLGAKPELDSASANRELAKMLEGYFNRMRRLRKTRRASA